MGAFWNVVDWKAVATSFALIRTANGVATLSSYAEAKWNEMGNKLKNLFD